MADQSLRFNFYISSIKRTKETTTTFKKEREVQQFQVCASTARWMGSIANRELLTSCQVTKKKKKKPQTNTCHFIQHETQSPIRISLGHFIKIK